MKTNDSNRRCPKCGASIPADAPQGLCPQCVLAEAATVPDPDRPGPAAAATGEIPSLERVRAAFPQLEILELIGRGGMGFVFRARQPHLDRFVALKLLPDKLARDPQFAERFNREGRVLARLNHPNIVSVFDFGRTAHFYFLTMEFVDGVNLRQAMRAGRFSPAEALGIVPKICEALQYAHEQGVLHRDIKPENILLDARGRVKIADFGIAKLVGDDPASVTLTGTGAALGTPHYMAPEQLEKPAEVDHRADIYSLGVVFYEMLTGELPIGRFAPPSAKTPVNTHVDDIVFRTLEKDREKRFQSAGEVKTQVEHLTESGATPPGAPAAATAAATGPWGHRASAGAPRFSPKAIGGAVLTGLGLLVLGGPIVLVVLAGAGLGRAELPVLGVPGGLCALAGTVLGWMALSDIRDSRGTVRGLPLAVFAATTWPLLTLVGTALGLPWLVLVPTGDSGGAHWLGRGLVLLLPAGVLTFALWAVQATTRWAANQPPAQRRGVLKWVFAGLVAVGLGLALTSRHGGPDTTQRQPPLPRAEAAAATLPGTEPLRVQFKVPKGQIAVFELCRHDEFNQHELLPSMSGFFIAPADESVPGEVVLEPVAPDPADDLSRLRWTMNLLSADGGRVGVGAAAFGPLRLRPDVRMPLRLPTPGPGQSSLELPLTHANPDDADDPSRRLQPALGLAVTFVSKPVMYPGPDTPVLGGSTNWETGFGLAAMVDAQRAALDSNAPVQIRCTVTGVALRDEAGARWLALDYVANVDTNWVTVFRAEASGFETETRAIRLLEGRAGVQAVRHERAEVRLPARFAEADAVELRDELAKALVAQPVDVPAGREVHLFKLPVGDQGLLSVMMAARPARETPFVRLTFTAVELEPRGPGPGQRLVLEYRREDQGADLTIQSSGRFPGETVNLTGATYVEGGSPGRPARERHRLELDLPKSLVPPEAEALRQRLAQKWLPQPLVVHPGDQHTLFDVPAEGGTPVRVTVLGRLPDRSQ